VYTGLWWGNLGNLREREDNIKIDIQEVGWGSCLDCSGSEWGQVASTCKRYNEPSGSTKCWEFLD